MKIRSTALSCAALLALSGLAWTGQASAGEARGPYVGIAAGWDGLDTVRIDVSGAQWQRKYLSTDDNAIALVDAGYRFDNHWRLEGEFNYTYHNAGKGEFSGHATILGGMVNALYEFDYSKRLGLALGAGIGFGTGNIKITGNANSSSTNNRIDDKKTAPQWQLIAEANYTLSPHFELFGNYRFRGLQVDDDEYGTRYYTSSGYDTVGKVHALHDHVVLLGIRYFFNSPAEPPKATPIAAAPPPPPPPPVAPPPPPVTSYVVFFDFAKADLTDQAQQIIAAAVKTAKSNGFVRIHVVGHTDTVGGDQFNVTLSQKRADAVKAAMTEQGLTSDSIAVEGKGFHDLLVPTGKDVKEPQNRRAVIDLGK